VHAHVCCGVCFTEVTKTGTLEFTSYDTWADMVNSLDFDGYDTYNNIYSPNYLLSASVNPNSGSYADIACGMHDADILANANKV
jgi:hypothetical protein